MPLKYALYPGCAAKGATPELYQSTMAIIGRLGIEVVELAAASCCGAGVVGEADPDTALALNARTFAQAEQLGLDIMTICGTCQGVMGPANKRLKEPGSLIGSTGCWRRTGSVIEERFTSSICSGSSSEKSV